LLWRVDGGLGVAINASPVIAEHAVFVANGSTNVFSVDVVTGRLRWKTLLDHQGFEWGNATVGAPAYARGIVIVPTLYADAVALDATTGAERWRYTGKPGPIRTTHYRGGNMTGCGLSAVQLETGDPLWHGELGAPLLGGPAVSGSWLVVAGFDGVVRGLSTARERDPIAPPTSCVVAPSGGCCDANGAPPTLAIVLVGFGLRRRRA
jgi:outer membrane protein assembly factor BamB